MTPLVITIPFSPVLFHLGPIPVHWYGIGYAVAFLSGLAVAGRHLRTKGVPEGDYADLAFWSIVVGLAAARLYYDVQNGAGYFLTHPQQILATWQGGMAYFGALFAVPLFVLIWSWRRGLRFWLLADAAVLFAAVGQPIGRIGNIFNGDIVGYASSLPWAVAYTSPDTLAPRLGVGYQPAAVYELLAGLVILGVLLVVRARLAPRAGGLFLLYLALYAVSQFSLFYLRANSVTLLGLKQGQLSALVLLLLIPPIAFAWRRWPDIFPAREHRAAPMTVEVGDGQQA